MVYNLKIIKYNNEIQLNRYNYDIEKKEGSVLNEISKHHTECTKQSAKINKQLTEVDYEVIALKNSKDSLRRTIQSIYNICRANNWDYFSTFTFANNRYDYDYCKKLLQKFFNNFSQRNTHIEYLCVPEQHKDGAWHFHALLIGNIKPWLVPSPYNAGRYIWECYKYGINEIEHVRDANRVSMYITKYITKSVGDKFKNKRRYFCSQGLRKGEVICRHIDNDNIYDFIQSNFPDYEFAYIKTSQWGIDNKVDYIQLKKRVVSNAD